MSSEPPFQQVDDEKTLKKWCIVDRLQLSAAILDQWHQPVASVIALDPLHWKMCTVSYRRTTMAFKMANKYGTFFDFCLFAYNLVVRRGYTV